MLVKGAIDVIISPGLVQCERVYIYNTSQDIRDSFLQSIVHNTVAATYVMIHTVQDHDNMRLFEACTHRFRIVIRFKLHSTLFPNGPIDNKSELDQVMAWHRISEESSLEQVLN